MLASSHFFRHGTLARTLIGATPPGRPCAKKTEIAKQVTKKSEIAKQV